MFFWRFFIGFLRAVGSLKWFSAGLGVGFYWFSGGIEVAFNGFLCFLGGFYWFSGVFFQ